MRKIYILDTSVLVYDPRAFTSFVGNDVIIPINVLDELDKLKTFPNEAGKNARAVIRALDALCTKGEIHKGIQIENDILLRIDTSYQNTDMIGTSTYVDNKILACACTFKDKPTTAILVSKDINLRIRARAFNLKAEDYEKDKIPVKDLYEGFQEIVSEEIGLLLDEKEELDICFYDELKDLYPNECVNFVDKHGNGMSIGRRIGNKIKLIQDRNPWGLELRNKEQAFAVDMLCDPKLPLVSLMGFAGTGKTLVAVATGLEMVLGKKAFDKLIIYRPIQPMGNDIGFLPGEIQDKLDPWMAPIKDSMEFLFASKNKKSGGNWADKLSPQYADKIEMCALTYIRGRSIANSFIILDEAQNLSKEEIKTILTRASSGTKIVLTGDISQIDNSNLDATNNGLSYIIEKFKTSELAGNVTFSKGERSALATLASEIL